jgi:hypothetical protein
MTNLHFRNFAVVVCLTLWSLNSAQAQAPTPTPDFNRIWTTVGSAGTVDEASTNKVLLDHSTAQLGRLLIIQPAARSAKRRAGVIGAQLESAVIRYNVTPVDGFFVFPQVSFPNSAGVELRVRFLNSGGGAKVIATLIEVDQATGVETTRMIFDSTGSAVSNAYQLGFKAECGPTWRFDFKNKAYYIEATLTHSAFGIGSAAGIQMIKIDNSPCKG